MSVILQPQKDYPLVRQISNHLDVNTYYVQAVVRDADGVIIDTVNLTDQGDQRFQKRWRVPTDRSGQGSYISIVTSVYTDSGYTTKSSNYGDEETTYLIFDRVMPAMRGGGGGTLDSSTIRRIIGEELDKREKEEKEIEFPEMPKIPEYSRELSNITTSIQEIKTAITRIPTEKVDFTHVLTGIQNLAESIKNKEVTPETDLTPVIQELNSVIGVVNKALQTNRKEFVQDKEELKKAVEEIVRDGMENTEFTQEMMIRPKRMNRPAEEKAKGFDLRKFVK